MGGDRSSVSVPPPFSVLTPSSSGQSQKSQRALDWTCFGYSFKLSRLIMKLATINEEPQYDTPLGNFHSLSTPFSKVADP